MVDCTGVFKTAAKLAPYFEAGVKKVIVSAPVKDGGALNIVYGINHHLYDGSQALVTAASCTTNCLAPVVKVIHDSLGIRHGSITTIHDVTNTQTIVDRPAKDMRRARSADQPHPHHDRKRDGDHPDLPRTRRSPERPAVRVPLLNASLTDCVFEVERSTTVEEVNALFAAAAAGPLKGILGYETRPLVSSDFTNDPRSAIIDGPSTMVTDGTQVKIYAWYDNEWGYACRLAISCGWWPSRCDHPGQSAPRLRRRHGGLLGLHLSDGALRMLVLLHFNTLGFSPVQLAWLFLLYEVAGIVTNLAAGWLAARFGLAMTLYGGLVLQIAALIALSQLDPAWTVAASVAFVMAVQGVSGVAKDLAKMSSKSAVKLLAPP